MTKTTLLLSLILFFSTEPVWGQEESSPPAAEAAEEQGGPAHKSAAHHPVFPAFAAFARAEQRERIVASVGGALGGGAMMAVGAPLAHEAGWSTTPWFVVGGTLTGLSLLALIAPTDAEQLAKKHRAKGKGHTLEEAKALEEAWKKEARRARTERYVGATIGALLSVGSVTAGALVLNGEGDLNDNERRAVGGLLLGFGIGGSLSSAGEFLLPSRTERMYETYAATQQLPTHRGGQWCWGLSAVPAGAGLSLQGSF